MKAPVDVIIRPVISEKSYAGMAKQKYVFQVSPRANKVEVSRAVQDAFSVRVDAVNIMVVKGKERSRMRRGGRVVGRSRDWKKAIVTLHPGDSIGNLFEGL